MFKSLYQNLEIRSFLDNFESGYWKQVVEAICLYGIRKFRSKNLPANLKTIEDILRPSDGLQQTLTFMKHELKHLSTAIKRIERKTQSSADLFKDISIPKPQKVRPKIEEKGRAISTKGVKPIIKKPDRSFTPNFLGIIEGVVEPRVCNLNDAKEIIKKITSPRESIETIDLFRSKATNSTQEASPKYLPRGYSPRISRK